MQCPARLRPGHFHTVCTVGLCGNVANKRTTPPYDEQPHRGFRVRGCDSVVVRVINKSTGRLCGRREMRNRCRKPNNTSAAPLPENVTGTPGCVEMSYRWIIRHLPTIKTVLVY